MYQGSLLRSIKIEWGHFISSRLVWVEVEEGDKIRLRDGNLRGQSFLGGPSYILLRLRLFLGGLLWFDAMYEDWLRDSKKRIRKYNFEKNLVIVQFKLAMEVYGLRRFQLFFSDDATWVLPLSALTLPHADVLRQIHELSLLIFLLRTTISDVSHRSICTVFKGSLVQACTTNFFCCLDSRNSSVPYYTNEMIQRIEILPWTIQALFSMFFFLAQQI